MNREIKFRAWLPKYGVMLFSENAPFKDWMDIWQIGYNGVAVIVQELKLYIAPEQKVMQFTGLRDKNGVEIFEGDIICTPSITDDKRFFNAPVVYNTKIAQFVKQLDSKAYTPLCTRIEQCTVVGNIHQNPELL